MFSRSYLTIFLCHALNLLLRSTPLLVEGCKSPGRAVIRMLILITIRCFFMRSGELQVFMQPRLHVSETQSLDPRAVMSMAPQRPRLRLLRSQTLFCDDARQACGCATDFFLRPTARSSHGSQAIVKPKLHITTASIRPTLFNFMLTNILHNTKSAERI